MSWIQELVDLLGKLTFYKIVNEYEQGLYFRNGLVIERRLTESYLEASVGEEKKQTKTTKTEEPPPDEKKAPRKLKLDEIVAEEKRVIRECGGYLSFLPFRRPKLPKEFRRNWINGMPLHKDRFSKVLSAGFYFHIPIIERIQTDSIQERVLNLGNVSVSTTDIGEESKSLVISCNIRYQILDLYRAYIAVHDYEDSLRDHTLSILNQCSRGKKFEYWNEPNTIRQLEEDVEKELRKVVTEKWGLKIHKVYVTDLVPCKVQRLLHEGLGRTTIPAPTDTIPLTYSQQN